MRCFRRPTSHVHRCSTSTHRNPTQPGGDLVPDVWFARQRFGNPPIVRPVASVRLTSQNAQQSSGEGDQQGEWMHDGEPRREVVSKGRDVKCDTNQAISQSHQAITPQVAVVMDVVCAANPPDECVELPDAASYHEPDHRQATSCYGGGYGGGRAAFQAVAALLNASQPKSGPALVAEDSRVILASPHSAPPLP